MTIARIKMMAMIPKTFTQRGMPGFDPGSGAALLSPASAPAMGGSDMRLPLLSRVAYSRCFHDGNSSVRVVWADLTHFFALKQLDGH